MRDARLCPAGPGGWGLPLLPGVSPRLRRPPGCPAGASVDQDEAAGFAGPAWPDADRARAAIVGIEHVAPAAGSGRARSRTARGDGRATRGRGAPRGGTGWMTHAIASIGIVALIGVAFQSAPPRSPAHHPADPTATTTPGATRAADSGSTSTPRRATTAPRPVDQPAPVRRRVPRAGRRPAPRPVRPRRRTRRVPHPRRLRRRSSPRRWMSAPRRSRSPADLGPRHGRGSCSTEPCGA